MIAGKPVLSWAQNNHSWFQQCSDTSMCFLELKTLPILIQVGFFCFHLPSFSLFHLIEFQFPSQIPFSLSFYINIPSILYILAFLKKIKFNWLPFFLLFHITSDISNDFIFYTLLVAKQDLQLCSFTQSLEHLYLTIPTLFQNSTNERLSSSMWKELPSMSSFSFSESLAF